MEYLKRRQINRKRLYSKVTMLGLIVAIGLLVRPTWNIYQKSLTSKKNFEQAQVELATLEARKAQLQSDLSYIQSDYGRDQEIRNKFGVTKEHETMVVIVRNETEEKPVEIPEKRGFFKRIWSGFLDFF